MTVLDIWMEDKGMKDQVLARKLVISRAQVSRIRRGKSGTNRATAEKIEKITGINWTTFIQPGARPRRRPRADRQAATA